MNAALLYLALLAASPEPATSASVQAAVRQAGKAITPALLAELQTLAGRGDDSAAQLLGEILFTGAGVSRDPGKACDQFERAAAKRADSAHNLATCYFRGDGRPADMPKARQLYQVASEKGLARAHCALGNMLISGSGGATEPTRGLDLCRRAAEAGEIEAQADYGGYLLSGIAGAKDAAAARTWLTRAAERGHANAALMLGKVHWNGDGTPKDNRAAARWWQLAYERGNMQAAFLLGQEAFVRLARSGSTPAEADPRILTETMQWLAIAAEKDADPNARSQAKTLMERLKPLQGRLGRQ